MRITARILSGNRCTSPGADVYITEALAPSLWETWAAIHNIGAKAKRAQAFVGGTPVTGAGMRGLQSGYDRKRPPSPARIAPLDIPYVVKRVG